MKKVRQILNFRRGTSDVAQFIQGRYKSTFHVTKSESPEASWKESYKEVVESFEKKLNEVKESLNAFQKETNDTTQRLEKQTKELNKQIEALSRDTSVHDELIKQNSQNMEKAIKKEVSYSVKEYDFVTNATFKEEIHLTNASFKEEMKVLRDDIIEDIRSLREDIKQQFITRDKLIDSRLSTLGSIPPPFGSRILSEMYNARQEANRWRIASGLAAATLLFGFYEYNEGKLFNGPDKDSTSSALKQ